VGRLLLHLVLVGFRGFARQGVGSELLAAVECHAREKRCRLVLLSSHSFQAPEFYARRGYDQVARINDYPVGFVDIVYAKRVATQ
jgi:GNAT superfamily N-acetyltransferase